MHNFLLTPIAASGKSKNNRNRKYLGNYLDT
jgi:hypothetical protein